MTSPFDNDGYEQMRHLALRQAGGLYDKPSAQSDAMTALYLIATLINRVEALEAEFARSVKAVAVPND